MALAYLIESRDAESAPVYYDPAAGRNSGHGVHGWVQDKSTALGFATAADAQKFIDALLPRQANTCRPVPFVRHD